MKHSAHRLHVCAVLFLCALVIFCASSCRDRPRERAPALTADPGVNSSPQARADNPPPIGVRRFRDTPIPQPPDLAHCTRIEVEFCPPLSVTFGVLRSSNLLTCDEESYLETLEPIVVEDENVIQALADDVSTGTYESTGMLPFQNPIAKVACYRQGGHLTSFTDYYSAILTEDGHLFHYDRRSMSAYKLPHRMQLLAARAYCCRNLRNLYRRVSTLYPNGNVHPPFAQWCDVVEAHSLTSQSSDRVRTSLQCPSANQGRCHYAMNPNCEPNSPGDTVLLFETDAGWNQHGGPELFTFDNHDPKGGCVLLNDGTVKFIRTEEELRALHWK